MPGASRSAAGAVRFEAEMADDPLATDRHLTNDRHEALPMVVIRRAE